MIERLYADSIEQSIQRDLLNPGPAPEEGSFSTWSFTKAGAKGAPAGAFDAAGGISDLLSGFATPYASIYEEGDGPATKAMREGRAFDSTAGNILRAKADEFAPDPATAHRSELVVHGVVKAASKAVASVATMGPYAGGAVFGLEESNNEYQRMIQRGIDPETAAKVAGVVGVASAVGAAAPAGGSTVLRTLGIVAATGPATYVAQEKLSKDILQEAGYQHEADQHDPTDALGLMLSIGVPGAVGALHVRNLRRQKMAEAVKEIESGGKRYGPDGKLLTSPKGAQGEMQVMPGTATDPGFGVTPAKDNSPDELARVGRDYLDAMQTRYGDPEKALAAYNAGPGAVDAAVKKHGDNWLAHMPDETKAYIGKARRILGEENLSAAARNTEVVDAARVKTLDETIAPRVPENHPEGYADVLRAMDEVGAGRVHEDLAPPDLQIREAELQARIETALGSPAYERAGVLPKGEMVDGAVVTDRTMEAVNGQPRQGFDPQADLEARAAAAGGEAGKRPTATGIGAMPEGVSQRFVDEVNKGRPWDAQADIEARAAAAKTGVRPSDTVPQPEQMEARLSESLPVEFLRPRFREPNNFMPAAGESIAKPGSTEPAAKPASDGVPDAAARAAVKKLEAEQPDMPVKLPGSDETVTVKEALERIEAQRAEEAQEADWVKVALECALSGGPKPPAPEPT